MSGEVMTSRDGKGLCSLSLLGRFEFRIEGAHVELPRAAERLLAYLALQHHRVTRHKVAGVLWPDVSEERSLGSLRSALWRLRRCAHEIVDRIGTCLQLSATTVLDIDVLSEQSHQLVDAQAAWDESTPAIDPAVFGAELLPGWYDDWVLSERERLRQLSLHSLEALSRRHMSAGRIAEAIEAAWRAIALEPLRETAYVALIDAHLAEGNVCEAIRQLRVYADILDRELGVQPSPHLMGRLTAAVSARGGAAEGLTLRPMCSDAVSRRANW